MATRKHDRRGKSRKKIQPKGQVIPSEDRKRGKRKDSKRRVPDQPQIKRPQPEKDSGFSILDILDVRKALRYLLSLIEPMIPERYRRLIAIAVVLVGVGFAAYTYRWLTMSVPDIHGTVYYGSGERVAVPADGQWYICETEDSDEPLEQTHHYFKILSLSNEPYNSDQVPEDQTKDSVKVRLNITRHLKKALHKFYGRGNVRLALTFFPDDLDRRFTKKIRFNKSDLEAGKPLFTINLRAAPSTSSENRLCLKVDERVTEPRTRRNLRETMEYIKREAMRREWFLIISCKKFEQLQAEFIAYRKELEGAQDKMEREEDRYLYWPSPVQVTLGLRKKENSQTQWISVTDAQQRIPKDGEYAQGEWAVDSWETVDERNQVITEIVNNIRRTVIRNYPIRGRIKSPPDGGEESMVVLNVGSYMGVTDRETFNVLSEVGRTPIASIDVKLVSTGQECRGTIENAKTTIAYGTPVESKR